MSFGAFFMTSLSLTPCYHDLIDIGGKSELKISRDGLSHPGCNSIEEGVAGSHQVSSGRAGR